jgi:hypothetical protein
MIAKDLSIFEIEESGNNESGIALALVMLVLLSLSILIISVHYTNVTQTQATANYLNSTQAFYIAEAGIQRTIDWFSHKYTKPDWSSTTLNNRLYPNQLDGGKLVTILSEGEGSTFPITSFVSGSPESYQEYLQATNSLSSTTTPGLEGKYRVTATLLSTRLVEAFPSGQQRVERWRIESVGVLRNSANGAELATSENVAVIETLLKPSFMHAICSDGFNMNGQPLIDSYDSANGSYGGTNKDGPASLGSYSSSTGPFEFGNVEIGGAIDIPPPYQSADDDEPCIQAEQGCGENYCPEMASVPNFFTPTSGNSTPPFLAYSSDDCTFKIGERGECPNIINEAKADKVEGGMIGLANVPKFTGKGTASFWAKVIGKGVTIDNDTGRTGDGPLNIFVDKIESSVNIKNRVPADRNPVNIFVKSEIKMSGGDAINGNNGIGVNTLGLRLFLAPGVRFTISGNSSVTGIVYGPDLSIDVGNGKVDFYGVIMAGDLFRKNGSMGGVHFDRRLEQFAMTVFNFVPNSQVRRIF